MLADCLGGMSPNQIQMKQNWVQSERKAGRKCKEKVSRNGDTNWLKKQAGLENLWHVGKWEPI